MVRTFPNDVFRITGKVFLSRRMTIITSVVLIVLLSLVQRLRAEEAQLDFNRDIRPILSDKCFKCHGPDKKKRDSKLRFDIEVSAKGVLDGHRAIVPGKPDQSEMIVRITSTDEDEKMPPPKSGKKLSAKEIDLFKRWIAQGAKWSQHWAFVRPKLHPVPKVKKADWPLNWIDRFILARLESDGFMPSPEADRVTLIRRLSFDLTGLPPTPEEVDRFVKDRSDTAYEKLVDRLLASNRYGERMAMVWLDLVRYADTVGYHGDQDHNISPYRDYVIDAFNENMPFDRFTLEQLAGDLLPKASLDQKIASGYNRLLQTSHEGGVQPKEYMAIYAADRVRNLSAVWMGATMGCAQCHDHKFDPYKMKDHYSMVAFFADLDEAQHFKKGSNSLPTARPPEISVLSKNQRKNIEQLQNQIQQLEKQLAESKSKKSDQAKQFNKRLGDARKRRDALKKKTRKTMISVAIKPRTIRILPRGNWLDDSGPIVQPAVPEFLGTLNLGKRRATRLDLARWLTDAKNGIGGLSARVQVNRLWYLFHGVGIVKVLDDFGGQGQSPYHPELLDNLAVEFVQNNWNVKHMVKLIVSSRTYRQSSLATREQRQQDPYNRLAARQSRSRLPAEMIRDSALMISGLLVEDHGGASIKPYQPAGYYRHLNFPRRKYQHHTDSRQWRRGVYIHWQRQFLHPMLKALDAPSREECTAERPRSNTPTGALTLLNDPTFVEAARVFAARIIREGGSKDDDRLDFAFRQVLSRKPETQERGVLQKLLAIRKKQYKANPDAARDFIRTGQAPAAENLDPVEQAAWTSVVRAIFNLNETITRN